MEARPVSDSLEVRAASVSWDASREIGFSRVGPDFLHHLSSMAFSGDVHALAEGRLFFKDEPIMEVTAPIVEAQLAESLIINAINLQVILASKVSRCVQAAEGRTVAPARSRASGEGKGAG